MLEREECSLRVCPLPVSLPLADQRIIPSPETFTVFEMSNPAGSYHTGVLGARILLDCPRSLPALARDVSLCFRAVWGL